MTFLIVGSFATKWRFEEKAKISAEEANAGVRGWKNVMANGGMASMIATGNFLIGGHEWAYFMLCSSVSVAASDTLASEIGSLDPQDQDNHDPRGRTGWNQRGDVPNRDSGCLLRGSSDFCGFNDSRGHKWGSNASRAVFPVRYPNRMDGMPGRLHSGRDVGKSRVSG